MEYTDKERKASGRYSSIKSKVKDKYNLDAHWKREDFIKWYLEQDVCFYCKSTLTQIEIFYGNNNSKRKATRGRTLEIDRKEDKEYSQQNCVTACYWCNNAKSDVFSVEDFMPIGEAIGLVIQKKYIR